MKHILNDYNLDIVGHTAYYFPIASPVPELRKVSTDEILKCLDVFQQLDAKKVTIHPDNEQPNFYPYSEIQKANIENILYLVEEADKRSLSLMIENLPNSFSSTGELQPLFDAIARVGFHLDIGYANLHPNSDSGS